MWRQELAESPFERILASAVTTLSLAPGSRRDGTRVKIALEQRPRGWARFAPLQFQAAGVRQLHGALNRLDAIFGEPGEPMKWWGWGEDEHEVVPAGHSAGAPAQPAGCRPLAAAEPGRARGRPAPRAAPAGERARAPGGRGGADQCATTARRGSSTPPARATPTSSGCARATPRAHRTLVVASRLRRRDPGGAGRLRRRWIAVVPFGGGTSVVGGVEPLSEGFAAVISARPRRLADMTVDRLLPDRRARGRPARTRGRAAPRRGGTDAGPLPAVVRVLDGRRLGGDPLGGPGLHRLRPDRRAGRGAAPGRTGRATSRARDPGERRRPGPA